MHDEEVQRLRREGEVLKQERESLKKAVRIFSSSHTEGELMIRKKIKRFPKKNWPMVWKESASQVIAA